ncbi:MAG: hypothetical protein DSO04_02320, partial [Hadesarchaea archaeon]
EGVGGGRAPAGLPAGGGRMCIGTVRSGKREIRDVALMEEEGDGYVVTTLLGERERVRGKIRKIDLENHLILVE